MKAGPLFQNHPLCVREPRSTLQSSDAQFRVLLHLPCTPRYLRPLSKASDTASVFFRQHPPTSPRHGYYPDGFSSVSTSPWQVEVGASVTSVLQVESLRHSEVKDFPGSNNAD